jgi:hypothetical protein
MHPILRIHPLIEPQLDGPAEHDDTDCLILWFHPKAPFHRRSTSWVLPPCCALSRTYWSLAIDGWIGYDGNDDEPPITLPSHELKRPRSSMTQTPSMSMVHLPLLWSCWWQHECSSAMDKGQLLCMQLVVVYVRQPGGHACGLFIIERQCDRSNRHLTPTKKNGSDRISAVDDAWLPPITKIHATTKIWRSIRRRNFLEPARRNGGNRN